MKIQKLGGYSAIVSVGLTIILLAIALPLASHYGLTEPGAGLDPAKRLAAYSGSPAAMQAMGVLTIVLGILGLFVAVALKARMQAKAPNLMLLLIIAASATSALTIIGVMLGVRGLAAMEKAADVSMYKPFLVMLSGLGTASDNISGWASLLIGIAAIRTRALPRFVAYVFLVLGILGVIAFTLPSMSGTAPGVIAIIIGLLYAIATVWLGIVLLRDRQASPDNMPAAQA
mgnify:CR=1 FL=1